jgi:hypothetical protein
MTKKHMLEDDQEAHAISQWADDDQAITEQLTYRKENHRANSN